MDDNNTDQLNANVAAIAAAYLGNPSNPVERAQIAEVISEITKALKAPAEPATSPEPETQKATPAAIRKSIGKDHLISFIDGKRYKSLKRHLAANGHTPQSYREHYRLKADYAMVAPSYSEQRSTLAKQRGFGQRPATASAEATPPAASPDAIAPTKAAVESTKAAARAAKAASIEAKPAARRGAAKAAAAVEAAAAEVVSDTPVKGPAKGRSRKA